MHIAQKVGAALNPEGLILRGGFVPDTSDGVPCLTGQHLPGTVLLIGNAGSSLWSRFRASPEFGTGPDPLDRWCRRVIGGIAETVGATPWFPFDGPPYLPFQRWAQRAEAVFPSPLGLLIHPVFGLWHAYRGALAFVELIDLPERSYQVSPCDGCADRPCLSTCPVGAFRPDHYEVGACRGHVLAPEGSDCRQLGCAARHACPVGGAYAYDPAQAAFHMCGFLGLAGAGPVAPLCRGNGAC